MRIMDYDLDNGMDLIVIFVFYFILFLVINFLRLFDIKGYWYSRPMFMLTR